MPTSFRLRLECNELARMIYEGSSRKHAEAKRDEHSEPRIRACSRIFMNHAG